MDSYKVSLRLAGLLLLLFCFVSKGYCQTDIARELVQNSYDMHDDTARNYLKGNAIFIIVTSKNCIKCFADVCRYLGANYTTYKVYALVLMPKDYLALAATAQRYKDDIACATDFYYYFVTANQQEAITKIYESPSPQMIIKTGNDYKYLTYSQTGKL
jgi:hypothetical protein